jgi:hypothetical protein
MNKRDIDLAKLHLLNTQMDEDQLTSGEVKAVAAHLMKNLLQMQQLLGDDDEEAAFSSCCELIETCPVQILKKTTPIGQPAFPEDILCRKGKASTCCLLLLNGKVGRYLYVYIQ